MNSVWCGFDHETVLYVVLCSVVAWYLETPEDVEHNRQTNREQLLSVFVLLDGAEVSE